MRHAKDSRLFGGERRKNGDGYARYSRCLIPFICYALEDFGSSLLMVSMYRNFVPA